MFYIDDFCILTGMLDFNSAKVMGSNPREPTNKIYTWGAPLKAYVNSYSVYYGQSTLCKLCN